MTAGVISDLLSLACVWGEGKIPMMGASLLSRRAKFLVDACGRQVASDAHNRHEGATQ